MINDTKPKMQAWAYGKGDGSGFYGVVEAQNQKGQIIGKRISKKVRLTPQEALQDAIILRKQL